MGGLADKKVLVTGGAGSVGSELVNKSLRDDAAVVRVLDNNEQGLFRLKEQYSDRDQLRFLVGNVRDRERLVMAMEDIDVVFHAAGLKHVDLNEYNPFEAVKTNIQGTQNAIHAAIEEEVKSFITVSTDKASNPVSVMGATKLVSERLVIAANNFKGPRETKFGCVRFGNVIGSSGSVVPIFMRQIKEGGPVEVTNPDMTRFVMPIKRAAELVLRAEQRLTSGEVFVLKMPTLQIGDLAEAMVAHYAPQFDRSPDEIDIKTVGARPSERTHEKLISPDETSHARELEELYVILPQIDVPGHRPSQYSDAKPVDSEYTSADGDLLAASEIVELIERSM